MLKKKESYFFSSMALLLLCVRSPFLVFFYLSSLLLSFLSFFLIMFFLKERECHHCWWMIFWLLVLRKCAAVSRRVLFRIFDNNFSKTPNNHLVFFLFLLSFSVFWTSSSLFFFCFDWSTTSIIYYCKIHWFYFCFCFVFVLFCISSVELNEILSLFSFLFSLFSFSSHQGLWGVLIDKDFKTTYYCCCDSHIQDVGLDWKGFGWWSSNTLCCCVAKSSWGVLLLCAKVFVCWIASILREIVCQYISSVCHKETIDPPSLLHCYMKGLFSFILFLFFLPLSPSFLLTLIFSLSPEFSLSLCGCLLGF